MNKYIIIFIIILLISYFFLIKKEPFFNSKGAILMYCTPNIINDYAQYSIYVNQKYAKKHNYDFILITEPYDNKVTHAWQKIPAILELLYKNYDFVMYIDADAVINKDTVKIEKFINKYSGDILFSSDEANSNGNDLINGGVIIAKNNMRTKKLLLQWWNLRYLDRYKEFTYEQKAMTDIVRNQIPDIDGSIVSVAPENEFNSIYYEIADYVNYYIKNNELPKSDNYILHFMSSYDISRKEILKKFAEQI